MKKIFFIFIAVLLVFLFVYFQTINKSTETEESVESSSIKVGFCPTMQVDAERLQKENENINLVSLSSAGEVLANLEAGKIDLALIGRKAEKTEISKDILERKMFETGFTLINSQKSIISKNEIANLEVKTCLDKSIQEDFSEFKIIFEQDCNYQKEEIWLISWNDWTDDMELLIPVDENGKIKKYRSPFLYGNRSNLDGLNF